MPANPGAPGQPCRTPNCWASSTQASLPDYWTTGLFLSVCESGSPGTVSATFDIPSITGIDWGIFGWPDSDAMLTGDLDHDCDVDVQDLASLLGHFGIPSGGGAAYEDGDLFGDGGVDLTDLGAFLSFFGDICP